MTENCRYSLGAGLAVHPWDVGRGELLLNELSKVQAKPMGPCGPPVLRTGVRQNIMDRGLQAVPDMCVENPFPPLIEILFVDSKEIP